MILFFACIFSYRKLFYFVRIILELGCGDQDNGSNKINSDTSAITRSLMVIVWKMIGIINDLMMRKFYNLFCDLKLKFLKFH